jgi:hypothetical protein
MPFEITDEQLKKGLESLDPLLQLNWRRTIIINNEE